MLNESYPLPKHPKKTKSKSKTKRISQSSQPRLDEKESILSHIKNRKIMNLSTSEHTKPKSTKKIRSKSAIKTRRSDTSIKTQSLNTNIEDVKSKLEAQYREKYNILEEKNIKQYELNNYQLNKMKLSYEERINILEKQLFYCKEINKQAEYTIQKIIKRYINNIFSDTDVSEREIYENRISRLEEKIAV